MSTIEQIDKNHFEYRIGETSASQIFVPEKYKTYGAARKAMKTLMDGIGYESLTQEQKEIVGRWSLITDQSELDNLFDSNEQAIISDMHQSQIKILSHSKVVKTISSSYKTVDHIIYNGSINNEILTVKVVTNVNLSGTYSIRLYDSENVQVIAEKTGLTNTTSEIIDLGTILNQAENNTVLELQIKQTSPINNVIYKSTEIEYL